MRIEEYDIGDMVVCDICGRDYTTSDITGGMIFVTKGVCPECVPALEYSAMKYGETEFIRERAKAGETFRAFVLRVRQGNNRITVKSFP